MSEYKCPELDCNFHIGFAGQVVTDEDFEQQDYYFEEIEQHAIRHEEQKRLARCGVVEQISAGHLATKHIGSQIRVLGEELELLRFAIEKVNGQERVSLTLHRWINNGAGPVPESLFWDVPADALIDLVRPSRGSTAVAKKQVATSRQAGLGKQIMNRIRKLLHRGLR